MPYLKVSVTTPLIERATVRDSRHCMIAEAIQAARPDFRNVQVDLATIRWTNPRTKKRYICLTPEAAAAALVQFDQGEAIEPFDLTLQPIQVTPSTAVKETTAEARAEGRTTRRRSAKTGAKTVKVDDQGRVKIEGGEPIPGGHLSNVQRSNTKFRAYGRRLLAK